MQGNSKGMPLWDERWFILFWMSVQIMPLKKSMRAKLAIRVLVHLNRISRSAFLQTSSKVDQTFLTSSTPSNSVSIYTSLCHKSRVRLRVTCDFGLWRRRGEKRNRCGAPAHFSGGEVNTVIAVQLEASSI
jgi:hypothetical protein